MPTNRLSADKNLKSRLELVRMVEHLGFVEAATEVTGVLSYLLARIEQKDGVSKSRAVMEHCFKHIRLNQNRSS